LKVGILSLQGSFFDHQKSLDLISLESLLVKTPEDLDKVDGIILPGGESTAMSKISSYNNLYKKLDTKIKQGLPTLSTCAGTIILAKSVIDGDTHIPNIDIEIQRNAYGRQNESFEADVKFLDNNDIYCFIRAPKIIKTLKNDVKVNDKIKKMTVYLIFNNFLDLHIQTQPNNLSCYFYQGRKSFLLYT